MLDCKTLAMSLKRYEWTLDIGFFAIVYLLLQVRKSFDIKKIKRSDKWQIHQYDIMYENSCEFLRHSLLNIVSFSISRKHFFLFSTLCSTITSQSKRGIEILKVNVNRYPMQWYWQFSNFIFHHVKILFTWLQWQLKFMRKMCSWHPIEIYWSFVSRTQNRRTSVHSFRNVIIESK